jgi:hypothetical protein
MRKLRGYCPGSVDWTNSAMFPSDIVIIFISEHNEGVRTFICFLNI